MTFVLFNNGSTDTTATLKMTDKDGNPLSLSLTGFTAASTFSIPLPKGSSKMLQTDLPISGANFLMLGQ
jgi:hypothetical protein